MLRQHLGPGHTGSPEVFCPFLVMSPEPEMMVSIIDSTDVKHHYYEEFEATINNNLKQ